MTDLARTPAQLADLDAITDRMHYERHVAPDLAARYDDACQSLAAMETERNTLRRRVQALEDVINEVSGAATLDDVSTALDRLNTERSTP